jgi:2-(3-amino-3-carboxypropyl)histidine synthase
MKGFDFEEERIKIEVAKVNAKRVLLQLPEGLKPEAPRLAKLIEKTGALPIISADPCYGACDVATAEAEALSVDLIIHFGHAKMLKHEKVPTLYLEARATATVDNAVAAAIPLLAPYSKIGLATTVQHVQTLDVVRELLVRAEKTVVIGDAGRLPYPGQVVGCDFSNVKSVAADVGAFLFVGGGKFHALGVALATSKPTIVADPYDATAYALIQMLTNSSNNATAASRKLPAPKIGVLISVKQVKSILTRLSKSRKPQKKQAKPPPSSPPKKSSPKPSSNSPQSTPS